MGGQCTTKGCGTHVSIGYEAPVILTICDGCLKSNDEDSREAGANAVVEPLRDKLVELTGDGTGSPEEVVDAILWHFARVSEVEGGGDG